MPGLRKLAVRGLVVLLLDWAALLLLGALLSGFDVHGPAGALVTAVIAAALNALVWPTLSRLALPLSVLTLGGASLVLNGGLVAIAAAISPGASIDGWFAGVAVAAGLAIITTAASALLAIDDDDTWQRNVVRRQARRAGAIASDVPGVVFLEIDGLAYEVLRRALRDGNAPVMARWLREGTHRLECWETDWSSQTGACQAGLLHGDNDDMPAFRWWEKDRGRAIVTNHPRDAQELERRHSDGRGLLHEDGASRANILSGDAAHSMLTMSTVLVRGRGALGRDYAAYFARPYAVMHTGALAFADYVRERRAQARQVRDDVHPRIARSRMYALVRAWATVVQRDLQVSAIVGDMMAGRPVVYSTFLAYDEVAHHSGIERHDTLAVLRQVDRQIARVQMAIPDAPRPYELVVLADHGQSQGETFADRYGVTLEDLVREACGAGHVEAHAGGEDEALAYLGAGLTEVAGDPTMTGRAVASATRGRRAGGAVTLEPGARAEIEQGDELPEIVVMASGCLGLVSFPREPGRVTLERLGERYPGLVPALLEHPGIGFVLVRSEDRGAVVMGAHGTNHLDEGRVEGKDPLAPFGPNAAAHVRRTDGFAHCPDLMINAAFSPDTEEVAAFEELVGSHGGMGGSQSFPFVLFPVALPYPERAVVGAEGMHRVLCHWLAELGHDAYRKDAEITSAAGAGSPPTSR
ncbi:MAG: phage holin family protein [Solirubrobacteraceae bacterium]